MINCRSLLYWGVRIALVLPQTPWSSFPELLLFLLLQNSLFLFTAKAYLISVPPQTPYLLPAPSTSSMQLFVKEIATCRTRVTRHCQRISPRNDSSLVTPSVSYNQSSFYFEGFTQVFRVSLSVCLTHPGWSFSASSVCIYCQYTPFTLAADSPRVYLSMLG